MKKYIGWSYTPFKPLFFDTGDIYICRLAPGATSIRLEWLSVGKECTVYYREKGIGEFMEAGSTHETYFDIVNLKKDTDYEFYVASGDLKSRVRLARTGETFGSVVNYLHPEDDAYYYSGKFLCSPSLVRHPDGCLLASMDLYANELPQNTTLIYRSDDDGKSWHYVSELYPCFWAKMFIHNGELYVLACSTEFGDLLIGKSTDAGKTFTEPVVLLRGGGRKEAAGILKNPQPVVKYGGYLWNTLEWNVQGRTARMPMVMSAPLDSDLLVPENWSFSEPVKYNPQWKGVAKGPTTGNTEGCLVVMPDGKLYDIMRYDMTKTVPNYGLIIAYRVDEKNPEKPLEFSHCINFPANHSKFEIKYDDKSGKYYSIASRIIDSEHFYARTLLSLMVSDDCENWEVCTDIINRLEEDYHKVGFQYVDFEFDGDDIIYLCRVAMNNASTYHDSNYSIFDRIKNFRDLRHSREMG